MLWNTGTEDWGGDGSAYPVADIAKVADNGRVDIELLHILDCPNTEVAAGRLREALDRVGSGTVPVRLTELATPEQAAAAVFAGSPTILLDGVDAFPSDGRATELACRV